jgi:hypothetical protein
MSQSLQKYKLQFSTSFDLSVLVAGPAEYCLEAKLEQFTHGVETFDVIVNHAPLLSLEKYYLPYVGMNHLIHNIVLIH